MLNVSQTTPWRTRVRVVLDTNILVSALLSREGPPGRVLALVHERNHALVTSPAQLDEFVRVTRRVRLRSRISEQDVVALLESISAIGRLVRDLPEINDSPDPDDNLILATAVAGECDLIVSGDKQHMLTLGAVRGIPIVSPREAISMLKLC